ncbi:MAG: DUF2723 domain-containing protein [Candidatus Eisenbacteria bacterium]|nr:DUF2723 domain-containing protein [Candidatus Eisenbacteria bacterium]
MNLKSRVPAIAGLFVLAATLFAYFKTLTPTVPFWDAGEFIAVSRILGIPHPPGTPFYVLIGRIFTMLPWGTTAQQVNALSAVAGALAVFISYLAILRLARRAFGESREDWQEWAAIGGAVCGALMLAFSDGFWENSVEAEVYQLMSLAQILVFWLGLRWWEAHDRRPTVGPLLLATYLMWLSVGLHLGVGVMGAPLIVLVAFVDWKVAILFAMPFLSLLRVPAGLEKMAGAVLVLGIAQIVWFGFQRKLPGWLVLLSAAAGLWGVRYAASDANFTPAAALASVASLVVPWLWMSRRHREGRVLLLALFLMVAGYSTHLYLPIRAAQHPAINEGAPATWDKLRDLLERKQYGEMNMTDSDGDGVFDRRGMTSFSRIADIQLNKEFWRYFRRQWLLFGGDDWDAVEYYGATRANGDVLGGLDYARRLLFPPGAIVPLLLGLAGALWQARRDPRRGFLFNLAFFGLNTAGLIVFLNFSDHEVRQRDYFFQSGYHAYTLWIGLGAVWLIGWVRESFADGGLRRWATWGTLALMVAMPFQLMRNMWFTHDRSGNYIARDYAYNMLAPLAPNSFMFTNGDNDTFPLWYIQQVEGFRKDVRIVNLSLLNTDWYIRQLRDEPPKLPVVLDDATIDQLGLGAIRDPQTGRVIYTNEFMVHHLLQEDRNPDGSWKRQPYFAVTVPEHYGYDNLFSLQGLVYEVKSDSTMAGLDVAATTKALYKTFLYRGLFTADGSWDPRVYKDENSETLSRNYAAAHLQLALYYRRTGDLPKAISEMERITRMFPNFPEIHTPLGLFYMESGDTAKAFGFYEQLAKRFPGSPEARYYWGATLAMERRMDEAIREFEMAVQLDPTYAQAYYGLYTSLRQMGNREAAIAVLQRWLTNVPNDPQASGLLQAERGFDASQAPTRRPPTVPVP